jgi:hypothetical protein
MIYFSGIEKFETKACDKTGFGEWWMWSGSNPIHNTVEAAYCDHFGQDLRY